MNKGDVVRIITDPKWTCVYNVGDIVTVREVYNRALDIEVQRAGDTFTQIIHMDEVEPVSYAPSSVAETPLVQPSASVLPTDAKERKAIPIATGCLDYFPNALAEVAKISKAGNDQHNPGEPLHWARGKSTDHADTIVRHLMERGTVDTDGTRHSAKLAWRALALLQEELEAAGAPKARGAW